MEYYSTNGKTAKVSLREAVIKGLAADKGLFMPERINVLPPTFYEEIDKLSFQEIAFNVAQAFFGEDISEADLRTIVNETLAFDCPVVHVMANRWALELFHGPTLAFKDVGARFMARLLAHFVGKEQKQPVNVLVATSGDTGSAVANGFLDVAGVNVFVLYPKGKVSPIQECQFTTLGRNITAIEVEGTFDDCQNMVKQAFMDKELNERMLLTSANSINVARFLPQAFYYFYAYAQMKRMGKAHELVVCVPSGNFGNITAALFAHRMGLPVKRFIAANNANDVFFQYLKTGHFTPKPSIQTIANAMDVGNPSNFARIYDLYGGSHANISQLVEGFTFSDEEIRATIRSCHEQCGYVLDPHGACGYKALQLSLSESEQGIFCETAHPAKFKETVDAVLDAPIDIPERLANFMKGVKQTQPMPNSFDKFKAFLLQNAVGKGEVDM